MSQEDLAQELWRQRQSLSVMEGRLGDMHRQMREYLARLETLFAAAPRFDLPGLGLEKLRGGMVDEVTRRVHEREEAVVRMLSEVVTQQGSALAELRQAQAQGLARLDRLEDQQGSLTMLLLPRIDALEAAASVGSQPCPMEAAPLEPARGAAAGAGWRDLLPEAPAQPVTRIASLEELEGVGRGSTGAAAASPPQGPPELGARAAANGSLCGALPDAKEMELPAVGRLLRCAPSAPTPPAGGLPPEELGTLNFDG